MAPDYVIGIWLVIGLLIAAFRNSDPNDYQSYDPQEVLVLIFSGPLTIVTLFIAWVMMIVRRNRG